MVAEVEVLAVEAGEGEGAAPLSAALLEALPMPMPEAERWEASAAGKEGGIP